jgi:hypothetical protein
MASVDGKSEKVVVPFGAYLLCKRLFLHSAATKEKSNGCLHQAPSSHTQ